MALTYTFRVGDTKAMFSKQINLAGFSTENAYAIIYVDTIRYQLFTDTWQLAGGLKVYISDLDDPSQTARITVESVAPPVPGDGETAGKEYVFEFSGQINQNSLMVSAANKIVALLGGKSVYIEGNKLVVVM